MKKLEKDYIYSYSFSLLTFSLLFALRNIYVSKLNNKFAGLIYELKKSHPEIDISSLIKLSGKDAKSLDLKKYGIYDGEIFDLSDIRPFEIFSISLIIFLIVAFFIILNRIYKSYTKRNIEKLIKNVEKINRGIYDLSLKNEDDDFSILENGLYKVTIKLKEEAENSKFARDKLKLDLENISHQIKNPLTSINLLIENLNDEEFDQEKRKEILSYLKLEVDHITDLILLLLNEAVVTSKTLDFKKKEIKLLDLLMDVEKVLNPIIKKNNIEIISNLESQSIIGDYRWEKEAYVNLLKNAIEHSLERDIHISARVEPTYTEILISNRAKPLNKPLQEKIFDRYYKLMSTNTNYGIGLNLCKSIIEEDGGKISCEYADGNISFNIKYYKQLSI